VTDEPYVEAVVVRAARPTAARPGDRAIIRPDGTIEGFVGGSCADETVRLQALRALETGEPVLVRILPAAHSHAGGANTDGFSWVPGAVEGPPDQEGAVVVANPCLSGGALEIFLEPHLPAPRVAVVGDSPVARALLQAGPPAGFAVRGGPAAEGDFGVVVASLGHGDEDAVAAALAAGADYVGLVASHRRGAAVLAALREAGVPEERLARVSTPAGLDIGARTPPEIAVSIVAELVAARRRPALAPAPPAPALATAVDPVCGMTVVLGPGTPTAEHAGETVAFCGDGCRAAYLRAHAVAP
jgi:xanthine dehydrogenase accessory factor